MNYIIILAKNNDNILELLEPLLKPYLTIVIIAALITMRIAHYFALFRIRKETIKIRELLQDSLLITDDNEKED